MTNRTTMPQASQLRRALAIREQIETLTVELQQLLGGSEAYRNGVSPRRMLSPAGRERIAAAQRLRWAKYNSAKAVAK